MLCTVRLVGAWIKIREVMDGAKRIKSEKLKEHSYREGHAMSLERKRVEWYENKMSSICGSR